jgi:SAM-dependent methyltransferase
MARKIPEANVQQAFALDTLVRLVGPPSEQVRMLCVGSFEDSSAYAMKRLGYALDEVDPVLNYDLEEFCKRPTTRLGSYNAVFSVSVIEHVENDELFLAQMASLLRPGGILLLTADFLNTWKLGDPKPACDFRFYTEADFTYRLLSLAPDCELVGSPAWANIQPDFIWDGIQYAFASLVLTKKQ